METISYFVVWYNVDKKERYLFTDISVDKNDFASEIEEKILRKIIDNHFIVTQDITIKHVSFLKSNK